MFTVYVLKSKTTQKLYVGQTSDLVKRLKQHNNRTFDKRSYTKLNGTGWEVAYKEEYKTRKEALKREKQLKSYQGRKFIKEITGP